MDIFFSIFLVFAFATREIFSYDFWEKEHKDQIIYRDRWVWTGNAFPFGIYWSGLESTKLNTKKLVNLCSTYRGLRHL